MKNEHKKSRDYLNMEIPLEKLAKPKSKNEKARYARRLNMERERVQDLKYSLNPIKDYRMTVDMFTYPWLTGKERRLEDKKSHDYLNRRIPFDQLGCPRTNQERILFRYRYYANQVAIWEDTFKAEEDEYYENEYANVKVMDQKGNLLTDLDDPLGLESKCHTDYLDMEHPLTFDWFDVPTMHCEVECYNKRVEIDPNLTDADKLIEIPWPDHPGAAFNDANGMYELVTTEEFESRKRNGKDIPHGLYKAIGLGACGVRAIDAVNSARIWNVEPIAMDMNWKTLEASKAPRTRWLWEEAEDDDDPDIFPDFLEKAPQNDNEDTIRSITDGNDTLVLALGLGGRSGAQIAPLLLSIAKEERLGASPSYVIGMAMLPFSFEENERKTAAEESFSHIREKADVVFVLHGDALLEVAHRDFPLLADSPANKEWTSEAAFRLGARVLGHSVTAMTALLAAPEDPEIEMENQWNKYSTWKYGPRRELFSAAFGPNVIEMKQLMKHCIPTSPGIGEGKGENAVEEAAKRAITSPLLGDALSKASCVLVHVVCAPDRLNPAIATPAGDIVKQSVDSHVRILSGASGEEGLGDTMRVTVFAIVPDEKKRDALRQAEKEKREAKRKVEREKPEAVRRAEKKAAERQSKYRGRTILKWMIKLNPHPRPSDA